jgi:hypothetical protein
VERSCFATMGLVLQSSGNRTRRRGSWQQLIPQRPCRLMLRTAKLGSCGQPSKSRYARSRVACISPLTACYQSIRMWMSYSGTRSVPSVPHNRS